MKKYLGILLIALFMCTVLIVAVSCNQEEQQPKETTYTVTFDTQGGSTIEPVTVKPKKAVARPTDPTRTNYVFFGWYKEAACKNVYNFKNAVNSSFTLYAKWVEVDKCCKVTYDLGYSGKTNVVWMEKGYAVTKPADPTRSNYRFLGWYADSEFNTEYDFNAKVSASEVSIYAKWIDNTTYEKTDPILPTGTGNVIPTTWSVNTKAAEKGYTADVPDIIYNFSGTITDVTNVSEELKAAMKAATEDPDYFDDTPKKVLFVFSDGWGVNDVKMSRVYKGELILDSIPNATQSKTDSYLKYSHDGKNNDYTSKTTTDSTAGGTQVLAGYKTRYGYISLDVDGNIIPNLSEVAKSNGWKVACVTNDNIADATPADSIIHDTNRYHSDVLYYKELMSGNWDLLMGWDWGMGTYFSKHSWADKLETAAKEGIKDANEKEGTGTVGSGQTAIQFFKALDTEKKAKVAPFLIYYALWEMEDKSRLNSWQRWTRTTEGKQELDAFLAWLDADTGLKAAISKLGTYGSPSTHVARFTLFTDLVKNTDFSKPVLGSWTEDTANYESASPNRGYLLHDVDYPSFPEMVAYTIYMMDAMAGADGGFFAMIENTCTDGWGHSSKDSKIPGMLNEGQCFDEGVAIAVRYVLDHPDTLLVITADHETGGYDLREGWENDISKIKSTTTGHSSQNVPLYAFGAGADRFSAENIHAQYGNQKNAGVNADGTIHEGWITGAILGQLMSGDPTFGEPADYKGQ